MAWEWVSISAPGVNGFTKCHVRQVGRAEHLMSSLRRHHTRVASGGRDQVWGRSLLSSAVYNIAGGGWRVGWMDLCVCECEKGFPFSASRALTKTRPRGPELKPCLRGLRADGFPLFQAVFMDRKIG